SIAPLIGGLLVAKLLRPLLGLLLRHPLGHLLLATAETHVELVGLLLPAKLLIPAALGLVVVHAVLVGVLLRLLPGKQRVVIVDRRILEIGIVEGIHPGLNGSGLRQVSR